MRYIIMIERLKIANGNGLLSDFCFKKWEMSVDVPTYEKRSCSFLLFVQIKKILIN